MVHINIDAYQLKPDHSEWYPHEANPSILVDLGWKKSPKFMVWKCLKQWSDYDKEHQTTMKQIYMLNNMVKLNYTTYIHGNQWERCVERSQRKKEVKKDKTYR